MLMNDPQSTENNRSQPVGSVDLHGLYVEEAIEYTQRAIKVSRGALSAACPCSTVHLTGYCPHF